MQRTMLPTHRGEKLQCAGLSRALLSTHTDNYMATQSSRIALNESTNAKMARCLRCDMDELACSVPCCLHTEERNSNARGSAGHCSQHTQIITWLRRGSSLSVPHPSRFIPSLLSDESIDSLAQDVDMKVVTIAPPGSATIWTNIAKS